MEGPLSITQEEHAELIELLNLCFRQQGGDMLQDYPRHVGLSNQKNIRVIKENGKIVSHISTSVRPVLLGGIPTSVAGVGAVATHPDARGKGYASILMKDTIERSEQQGADIMLISNDLNLYQRQHARLCGLFPYIEIKAGQIESLNGYHARRAVQNDLDQIIRLRRTLSTRYQLPREDMEALIQHKLVMDEWTEWWMIEQDNIPVGFGAVSRKDNTINLQAWAGHPDALHFGTAFWMRHYKAELFTFHAVNTSIFPLQWKRFVKDTVLFDGSVIVLNGIRFLERARDYIEERIGRNLWLQFQLEGDKQKLTMNYQDERISFAHGGEIAECFFGLPYRDVLAGKCKPSTTMYKVLSKFLPLPLVWYGLGYV